MPAKQLKYHSDARAALKRGVDAIANCVRPTLGPRGRNVLVEIIHGPPQVTHDGATIAKEIDLRAHFENMGVQLVKQAIAKMNGAVGEALAVPVNTVLARTAPQMSGATTRHIVVFRPGIELPSRPWPASRPEVNQFRLSAFSPETLAVRSAR